MLSPHGFEHEMTKYVHDLILRKSGRDDLQFNLDVAWELIVWRDRIRSVARHLLMLLGIYNRFRLL